MVCECGCGKMVKIGFYGGLNRFVRGHNMYVEEYKEDSRVFMTGKRYALGSRRTEEYKGSKSEEMMGNAHALGSKHSKEWKRNKSKEMMGNWYALGCKFPPHTEERKRQSSERMMGKRYALGYKHTEKAKRKLARWGEEHWNWQGGVSFDPYPGEFNGLLKAQIRARDGGKCQNPGCWKTAKRITVHHIDYNKENCHPGNLITLCNSCNSRANYGREFWTAFYSTRSLWGSIVLTK